MGTVLEIGVLWVKDTTQLYRGWAERRKQRIEQLGNMGNHKLTFWINPTSWASDRISSLLKEMLPCPKHIPDGTWCFPGPPGKWWLLMCAQGCLLVKSVSPISKTKLNKSLKETANQWNMQTAQWCTPTGVEDTRAYHHHLLGKF